MMTKLVPLLLMHGLSPGFVCAGKLEQGEKVLKRIRGVEGAARCVRS
jgi:hypothetical protein